MSSFWIVDRCLPGLVASAVWAAVLWLSHRKLWQRIEQLTAEQTRELSGHTADPEERLCPCTAATYGDPTPA